MPHRGGRGGGGNRPAQTTQAQVRTSPASTMQVRAMPTSTTRRDGVIRPHVHGSVGRQVVDDQDDMWRVEHLGLTHTATRRGMWWTT